MFLITAKLFETIGRDGYRQPGAASVRAAFFAAWGFLCGLLAQFAVMSVWELSPAAQLWAGLLPLQIGACGAASLSLFADSEVGRGCRRFGLSRPSMPIVGIVIKTLCWVYPTVFVITAAMEFVLVQFEIEPLEHPLLMLLSRDDGVSVWVTLIAVAAIIAPVTEEVLFRLILRDALAAHWIARPGVWTSVLFAFVHLLPEQMPGLFVLALVLQRLRTTTDGLWAPVLLHVSFNVLSLVAIGIYWAMRATGA